MFFCASDGVSGVSKLYWIHNLCVKNVVKCQIDIMCMKVLTSLWCCGYNNSKKEKNSL